MGELLTVKLRQIGNSVGLLIPKGFIETIRVNIGDEVNIALLKPVSKKELEDEIEATFGIAKNAGPFVRDKRIREF